MPVVNFQTAPSAGPLYGTIQDEGTPLAQENTIDFVGDGVTASAGSGKTIITVPGGHTLTLHDTTHSPVGLWQFSAETLADTSGNGFDFDGFTGTLRYSDIYPGTRGLALDGAAVVSLTATTNTLRITGDMTIECLLVLNEWNTTAGRSLISCGANGELETQNALYQVNMFGSLSGTDALEWLSESGAGVNSVYAVNRWPPLGELCHFAVTRVSNVIQFYLNGLPFGAASGALTTPTGGSLSILRLADNTAGQPAPMCVLSSLKIIASGLSAAQVKAERNRCLGNIYGIIA